MRIPIFILCLLVVYGSCRIYDEENVNLIESIRNDKDYKSDYSIVPLERSLSRHKRQSLLQSPMTKIALRMLGLSDNKIVQGILRLSDIINGILNNNLSLQCPKVEKISIQLLGNIILHPIKTIETVLCYTLNVVGSQGIQLVRRLIVVSSKLFKIALPIVHSILNLSIVKMLPLPPSIRIIIKIFNIAYDFLKLIGYLN